MHLRCCFHSRIEVSVGTFLGARLVLGVRPPSCGRGAELQEGLRHAHGAVGLGEMQLHLAFSALFGPFRARFGPEIRR